MAKDVLTNSTSRKKCKTCTYRSDDRHRGCDYILLTGTRRGCSAEHCTKYKKGPKQGIHKEPAWARQGLRDEY